MTVEQDRFTELTWTFLLWGLPEAEHAEWEAELDRRGEAGRLEVDRMREALASLALAAPPVSPPPGLRQKLLARLEELPAEPGSAAVPSTDGGRVVPLRRTPWEWVLAAAVAACLALVLAVYDVRLRSELREAQRTAEQALATAEDHRTRAEAALADADSARSELEATRRDLDAVASPQASVLTLVGTVEEPRAAARVFLDPQTGRAILFVYDLPVLPPRTVYELWAIKAGKPAAAGTFATTGESPVRIELKDASVLKGAEILAVTIEPAPGVPAPTGKMVLSSPS
jgi:anti-sigma-K factor RskA